jgi:hypothetical protein
MVEMAIVRAVIGFQCERNTTVYWLCFPQSANVNRSGNTTQSSQMLRANSSVHLSTSRCSQSPLKLNNVLSDSARAFSGCYKIGLIGNSIIGVPDTSAQICRRLQEQLRLLRSAAEAFKSKRDRCPALWDTWCCILTAVVFTQLQGILSCYSRKIHYIII